MMSSKQMAYTKLTSRFKQHKFEGLDLENPLNLKISSELRDHLNPWAHWQGNLGAKIVLIGQDWGDTKFFEENGGKDPDGNPTNESLRILFSQLGIEIGTPNSPVEAPLYFTNAVLGIKKGGMAKAVKVQWYTSTLDEYLKPLIDDIIKPDIIITMGSVAFDAARRMYGLKKMKLTDAIETGKFDLGDGKFLFPVAHCSGLGKRNRNFEEQKEDWQKIRNYLEAR